MGDTEEWYGGVVRRSGKEEWYGGVVRRSGTEEWYGGRREEN